MNKKREITISLEEFTELESFKEAYKMSGCVYIGEDWKTIYSLKKEKAISDLNGIIRGREEDYRELASKYGTLDIKYKRLETEIERLNEDRSFWQWVKNLLTQKK